MCEMAGPTHNPDYPAERVAPLRAYAAAAKQATVARLEEALHTLKGRGIPPTAEAIFMVSGLRYQVIRRNDIALRIWQAASPGLASKREQARARRGRRKSTSSVGMALARPPDPFAGQTRAQLVALARRQQERIGMLEARVAAAEERARANAARHETLALERVRVDLRIARLEADVARYEVVFGSVRRDRMQEEMVE